jgi:hypothetical protein
MSGRGTIHRTAGTRTWRGLILVCVVLSSGTDGARAMDFQAVPRPKPTPSATPAPRPKPSAARVDETPSYAGPATLLFEIDMACRIWIDGVLAVTGNAGDLKPVRISLGDHIVKVAAMDGSVEWQRTVKIEGLAQRILPTELTAKKAAEVGSRTATSLDATGTFIAKFEEPFGTSGDVARGEVNQRLTTANCELTIVSDEQSVVGPLRLQYGQVSRVPLANVDLSASPTPSTTTGPRRYLGLDAAYDVELRTNRPVIQRSRSADGRTVYTGIRTNSATLIIMSASAAQSAWSALKELVTSCQNAAK